LHIRAPSGEHIGSELSAVLVGPTDCVLETVLVDVAGCVLFVGPEDVEPPVPVTAGTPSDPMGVMLESVLL